MFLRPQSAAFFQSILMVLLLTGPAWTSGKTEDGLLYFYNQKTLLSIERQKETPSTGFVFEYYKNGDIKQQILYKDNQLSGYVRRYDKNGRLLMQIPYLKGELNGILRQFHDNGKLKTEITYLNQLPHGLAKYYASDGTLIMTINFMWGLPEEVKIPSSNYSKRNK